MQLLAETDVPAPAMGNGSDRPTPPTQTVVWQRDIFESLLATLGAAPIMGIARRFQADLRVRFADNAGRDALRRDAHAVVSSAGMLGFSGLSDAARGLEQACMDDADVALPLEALMSARRATQRCLAGLLLDETATDRRTAQESR